MRRYTVQQDCAGWVVLSEGSPRRAVSHHEERLAADNRGEHQGDRATVLIHEAAVTFGWVQE